MGLLHKYEVLGKGQIAHAAIPKGMLTTQGDYEFDDPFGDADGDADMDGHVAGPSEVPD